MVAAFYGKVSSDYEYNDVRSQYGDTTDPQAHVQACRALGLGAVFHPDGDPNDLAENLRKGRPTPAGWLHYGAPQNPTGGGHWSCLIGFSATHTIHHDPFGEADMVSGDYVSNAPTAGKGIWYSQINWVPRYTVNIPNNGYWMEIWE